MTRELVIDREVKARTVYGCWRIEERVGESRRHVRARCLECNVLYQVDLFHLRRPDRRSEKCKACSNRSISVTNRLPPKVALMRADLHYYKKAAKDRGHDWDLPTAYFEALILSHCYWCDSPPSRRIENSWDSMLVNGIDRLNNEEGYSISNSVACCKRCNYGKGKLSKEDFIEMCRLVVENDSRRNGLQE